MLQRTLARSGGACKRPLAEAACFSSRRSSSSGRSNSSRSARATVATPSTLLLPAKPDFPTSSSHHHHHHRRGFSSARLLTSGSSASSSSDAGDAGFWEGPLAAANDPSPAAAALQGLLPQRQVPDTALRFTTVAYVDAGSYIPFPHADGIDPRAFNTNPANFKVVLKVFFKELGLTEREEKRLRCLVGARYNPGRQELTLTTARFLSRAHNKQYLIYLLENLVAEAKKEKAGGSAAA